ncbi:AGAP002505-PA-like protein [Anopheles sinensis]|uniref:AGAP002505-PA-like protein n=1 Tax=Anopheles sinensis TaxID=74873 RepID=A0A084VAQ0_ANOSI|nr:AGAP002505-PA-like protein [Anopheles sinensis]
MKVATMRSSVKEGSTYQNREPTSQHSVFTDKVNYGGVIDSLNLKTDKVHQHRQVGGSQKGRPTGKPTPGSSSSDATDTSGSSCSDGDSSSSSYDEPNLPYPGFTEFSLKYLAQDTKPRIWCLQLITNPYPFQQHVVIFYAFSALYAPQCCRCLH